MELTDSGPVVREALHRMGLGPVALENIPMLRTGSRGEQSAEQWARLWRAIDQLGGYVVPSLGLHDGGGPILSLVAVVPDAVFRCPRIGDAEPLRMRPGTTLGIEAREQVLTCPGLPYNAVLHREPANGITKSLLAGDTMIAQVKVSFPAEAEVVSDVVAYLTSAGFVLVGGRTNHAGV
ncbi:hypothetical protein [Saccharothrix syringae]|uniref:Uncharacterized protein n=1 Tax=Saccharothrix syringae TaxID=103733 RepID=A0A5Q0H5M8_SACSY|nr:hypothetical protein [Saccharothrix syringae]QFZ21150.1 hypothetical protein EKG83_30545 [Saccharothrix syringae]